jgi:hypothetical protein
MLRDVETRRCCFLPGCWSSRRRTAVPRRRGAPEPSVLLGTAVAVRGRCMGSTVEPCFLVQGRVSVSPPRFELRLWLSECCAERARRGRACARLWPRTGTLWTGTRDSLVCLRAPAAARSAWTFHALVLAVTVRFPPANRSACSVWEQVSLTPPRRRGPRLWLPERGSVWASGEDARRLAGKPCTPAWSRS